MIIDTHTHFGDPSRPNPILHRTDLPDVYKELAIPEGVTGTVVVEARLGLDEIRWLSDLAEHDPFIVGIVGDIDLGSETFAAELESVIDNSLLLGVRFHDTCCREGRTTAGNANNLDLTRLLDNAQLLAAKDLSLDVHTSYERIDRLVLITSRLPGLRVVVNHIAENRSLGADLANTRWAEVMYMLAQYPQVYCKVSALVQMTGRVPAPVDVDYYAPTLDVLWDAFGENRLVYGSNWPQIEAVSDYANTQGIVTAYFQARGPEAVEKFFWKNAMSAYKWHRRDQDAHISCNHCVSR